MGCKGSASSKVAQLLHGDASWFGEKRGVGTSTAPKHPLCLTATIFSKAFHSPKRDRAQRWHRLATGYCPVARV